MKLRPHGTDTIDSRVCQQSLTAGRTSQHGEKSPKLLQTENKMEQEDSAGRTRFQNSSRAGAEARHPGAAAEVGWKDWLAMCTPALPVLRKRRQDSSVNGGQAWPRHSRPASATDTALKRRGREGKKGKGRWDQRTQVSETLQIANHRLFF